MSLALGSPNKHLKSTPVNLVNLFEDAVKSNEDIFGFHDRFVVALPGASSITFSPERS